MDNPSFSILKRLNITLDSGGFEWPKFDFSGIKWSRIPKLRFGDLTADIPIVQGGMGVGISLAGLASAVAEQGAIGVIAANSIGMLDPEYYAKNRDANMVALKAEIRKARSMTKGVIGVNIMVAVHDMRDLILTSVEEKADILFLGAGLPIKGIPVKEIREAGVKVVPIVSSARAANLIFKSWAKRYGDVPDGVVVEGPMAGGHLGFKLEQIDDPAFSLENILPEVVAALAEFENDFQREIPVIAAGGVYTGADLHRLFKLGAKGVQMGTRFVATHECDADIRFKQAYVNCAKDDIGIIQSPVGLPGRAIKSRFLEQVAAGQGPKVKCAWKCLASCDVKKSGYCISLALDNARRGELDQGFAFAGTNAYRVEKIISVRELITELKEQYILAEKKEAGRLRAEYESTLERLAAIKAEYVDAVKRGFKSLKDEYERDIEKGARVFREERLKTMGKLQSLKTRYSTYVEKAVRLKEELALLLERYHPLPRLNPDEA